MKTTRDWQTLALATIATILVAVSLKLSFAAQGEGAKYGSRDPRTCADKTLPKTGAPSAAQAADYVICSSEHVINDLYLVENVKVQVGKGRPYNPHEDINVPDIDTKVPIYPIRGSMTEYSCSPIYLDRSNLNRNCSIYEEPNAKGACYKDSFGDWRCAMTDATTGNYTARDVAPPGTPKTAEPEKNKAAQNAAPPTETKTQAAGAKDSDGFPIPDLSALKKWYDVVKYEYAPDEGYLYIYVKPKVEDRETEFYMDFKDKDGVLVFTRDRTQFSGMPSKYDAHVGDTVKAHISIPRENLLKQVVSAVAFRRDH